MRISGCREWQSCSLPCNETDSGKKRGHSPSSSRRHVGREPRGNPRCFSPVKTSYFSVRESTFSEIRLKTIQKKRCDFWESRRVLGFITQKMDSPFFMKRRKVVYYCPNLYSGFQSGLQNLTIKLIVRVRDTRTRSNLTPYAYDTCTGIAYRYAYALNSYTSYAPIKYY
jgi:hypothetical protein